MKAIISIVITVNDVMTKLNFAIQIILYLNLPVTMLDHIVFGMEKMGKPSIDKGKRGERLAVRYLKSIGFPDARRTAQHRGDTGTADVECPESLPDIHIEVKVRANIGLGTVLLANAITQANSDCGDKVAVVLWKRDRGPWCLTAFRAEGEATYCGDSDICSSLTILQLEQAA
jgi:hypothetical protein